MTRYEMLIAFFRVHVVQVQSRAQRWSKIVQLTIFDYTVFDYVTVLQQTITQLLCHRVSEVMLGPQANLEQEERL